MIMDPINTDMDNSRDFIGSPIQNQEQLMTQINVISRISNDFCEKMWLIIFSNFDM